MDADGVITWTPTYDQVRSHGILLRVRDVYGAGQTQPYPITVYSNNRPPMIGGVWPVQAVVGVAYSAQVAVEYSDGGTLAYALDQVSIGKGMTIDSNGAITWSIPTPDNHEVTVYVDDGRSDPDSYSFILEVLPEDSKPVAPQFTSTPPTCAVVGNTYQYTLVATDPYTDAFDYGYEATPAIDGDHELGSDHTAATFVWTPNSNDYNNSPIVMR